MKFLQNYLAAERWASKLGLTSTFNILNALCAHTHTHTEAVMDVCVCVCVVATESWEAVIMLLVSVRRSRGSRRRCCWEKERKQNSPWKHPSIALRCCQCDPLQLSCQRCKKQTGGGLESCLNGCSQLILMFHRWIREFQSARLWPHSKVNWLMCTSLFLSIGS